MSADLNAVTFLCIHDDCDSFDLNDCPWLPCNRGLRGKGFVRCCSVDSHGDSTELEIVAALSYQPP